VGNVYDAMKKFKAEQAAQASAGQDRSAPLGQTAGADQPDVVDAEAPRRPRRPRLRTNGYARELVAYCDRGGRLAEEYRALRTNLLARYDDNRFCMLVTSAEAAEGKTVTCLNLAFVLAELPDRRTIIIDCDLQKGNMNTLLDMPPTPGLADVLRGEAAAEDAIHETACENLFVMPSGEVEQEEVGELLSRPELEELIQALRREYDYVLLDTPPIRVAGAKRQHGRSISYSTAGILGRTAKDAVLVVRMNKTRRESIDAAIRQLQSANVRPVGLVLTHQRHVIPEFLYRRF